MLPHHTLILHKNIDTQDYCVPYLKFIYSEEAKPVQSEFYTKQSFAVTLGRNEQHKLASKDELRKFINLVAHL